MATTTTPSRLKLGKQQHLAGGSAVLQGAVRLGGLGQWILGADAHVQGAGAYGREHGAGAQPALLGDGDVVEQGGAGGAQGAGDVEPLRGERRNMSAWCDDDRRQQERATAVHGSV